MYFFQNMEKYYTLATEREHSDFLQMKLKVYDEPILKKCEEY